MRFPFTPNPRFECSSKSVLCLDRRTRKSSGSRSEGEGFNRAQRNPITLISKVHTLRIQTFNLPSTPSTWSSSTPSHQHLRAGFRQKSNSFCAIPTALLFAASPRMSVRNRASAMEQMTALFGSAARWPHVSAWSKPLRARQWVASRR